jgi:hypothetical protein
VEAGLFGGGRFTEEKKNNNKQFTRERSRSSPPKTHTRTLAQASKQTNKRQNLKHNFKKEIHTKLQQIFNLKKFNKSIIRRLLIWAVENSNILSPLFPQINT